MRVLDGEQVLARIVVGESDRWHHQPLWTALLERLSQDLPLVIEVVDTAEHVERLLPLIDEMVPEGLVTMEKVRVVKYAAGARPLDAKR